MSHEATKWAWDQRTPSVMARHLLLALADHHNAKTGQCNPGRGRLMEVTGQSRATVQRGLTELRNLKLIDWTATKRANSSDSTSAYVLIGIPQKAHTEPPVGSHRAPRGLTQSPLESEPESGTETTYLPPAAERAASVVKSQAGREDQPKSQEPDRDTAAVGAALGLGRGQTTAELLIRDRLADGWSVSALIEHIGVGHAPGLIVYRLRALGSPSIGQRMPVQRPAWCGSCDETTRQIETPDGRQKRCTCHARHGESIAMRTNDTYPVMADLLESMPS